MGILKRGPKSVIRSEIDKAIKSLKAAKNSSKWSNSSEFDVAIEKLNVLKNSL